MTETEWLECTDPGLMLEFLGDQASVRKLRLLCASCGRRVWHLLESNNLRNALDVLERYADNEIDEACLRSAAPETHPIQIYFDDLWSGKPPEERWLPAYGINLAMGESLNIRTAGTILDFFTRAVCAARGVPREGGRDLSSDEAECSAQASLVRDLFGNPFRPVSFDPACLNWNDAVIGKLARVVWDERSLPEGTFQPSHLAILADALEDAGCADAELLGHLRGPGVHIRGCWALDLVVFEKG